MHSHDHFNPSNSHLTAIHILKEGEQIGPFDLESLKEALEAGQVSANDMAWTEGQSEWRPLRDIVDIQIDQFSPIAESAESGSLPEFSDGTRKPGKDFMRKVVITAVLLLLIVAAYGFGIMSKRGVSVVKAPTQAEQEGAGSANKEVEAPTQAVQGVAGSAIKEEKEDGSTEKADLPVVGVAYQYCEHPTRGRLLAIPVNEESAPIGLKALGASVSRDQEYFFVSRESWLQVTGEIPRFEGKEVTVNDFVVWSHRSFLTAMKSHEDPRVSAGETAKYLQQCYNTADAAIRITDAGVEQGFEGRDTNIGYKIASLYAESVGKALDLKSNLDTNESLDDLGGSNSALGDILAKKMKETMSTAFSGGAAMLGVASEFGKLIKEYDAKPESFTQNPELMRRIRSVQYVPLGEGWVAALEVESADVQFE